MNFEIKNFGKIEKADIKLDGITIICGNNNTGKSTIGKALFAFYNSLYDYKSKIDLQKSARLKSFIISNVNKPMELTQSILDLDDISITSLPYSDGKLTVEQLKTYLEDNYSLKLSKENLSTIVKYLNLSDIDILNEYVLRYFNLVMNNQIKNLQSSNNSTCSVSAKIKGEETTLHLKKNICSCSVNTSIEHAAYYINNPFILDQLNSANLYWAQPSLNYMDRSVVSAISKVQSELNEDSMTNILESVVNKKDLDKVRKILKQAYNGNTVINHGKYYYNDNGITYDVRNLSAGLKSFGLIERLLETGVLKKKDVLILDEPEIHLHSEWQIIYAELIVVLQKVFDLTILIVTHSYQFLEAVNFFMKKHGTLEIGNYYIPKKSDKGFIIDGSGNDLEELKKNLSTGTFKLADMDFEFDMEHYND